MKAAYCLPVAALLTFSACGPPTHSKAQTPEQPRPLRTSAEVKAFIAGSRYVYYGLSDKYGTNFISFLPNGRYEERLGIEAAAGTYSITETGFCVNWRVSGSTCFYVFVSSSGDYFISRDSTTEFAPPVRLAKTENSSL
ncbi:hypothetical protein GCM10011380_18720 [Sphingomonas metalli]|uniref:Lipoprotein n=1 Tax=Sphingomonas metalli TaxID=1779358 RepID=A0A916WTY3_9SPHN|nr:hypothetical protein GCM10011380_18720 [Sphingomonas metalli]